MRYIKLFIVFVLLCLAGCFFLKCDTEKAIPHWKANTDRSKPKGEKIYDVIIVGSGFGGLSAGTLLAKNGYKVLILEKNDQLGGLCASYTKSGYRFCYGAEDIGGLFDGGPLHYLLQELKLDEKDFFVPNTRRFLVGNTYIDLDLSKGTIVEALTSQFGSEKKAIKLFFDQAKQVLNQAYDKEMVRKWGIRIPSQLIPEVMSEKWITAYPSTHKQLIEWQSKSYQDVLDQFFHDSTLKKLLSSILVGYFGGRPIKVPASTVVTTCFEYFFYGGNHALHTPQHFANTLAAFIEKHGGKILVSAKADQIIVDTHGVKGVRVENQEFLAPVVISNVNAKTTYRDLIDPRVLPPSFLNHINSLPVGSSAFALHLGVDDSLSSYPDLIQDKNNQVFIAISSNNDPSLAPEGKSAVVVREGAHFEDFIGKSPSELQDYLQQRSEALLEKANKLIPELNHSALIKRVLTPLFFEELIHMPLGSIYGFDESEVPIRPYFKSPVPGLYLSNACIGGPGVTSVVRNGLLCAHDIMQWQEPKSP